MQCLNLLNLISKHETFRFWLQKINRRYDCDSEPARNVNNDFLTSKCPNNPRSDFSLIYTSTGTCFSCKSYTV